MNFRPSTSDTPPSATALSPLAQFTDTLEVHLADSAALRRRVYRLRHTIYCHELGYEPPADADADLEFDAFDATAHHCLLSHRPSGRDVACLRLVPPRPGAASQRLPLQAYAATSLDHPSLHPDRLPDDRVCEVSRMAIVADFRHRSTGRPSATSPEAPAQDATPLLLISLFLASTALVGLAGRPHVFGVMAPRLPKLLARSGLHLTPVGRPIDFHGQRRAYYIDQRCAERTLLPSLRPLYRHLRGELATQWAVSASGASDAPGGARGEST